MSSTNTYATSPQVTGELFAASFASPTPSMLTTAVSDMQTAYTNASSRSNPGFLNLDSGTLLSSQLRCECSLTFKSLGAIGGLVLGPGLYKWTSGVTIGSSVTISGSASDSE
jgi:hypothetical protein